MGAGRSKTLAWGICNGTPSTAHSSGLLHVTSDPFSSSVQISFWYFLYLLVLYVKFSVKSLKFVPK